MSLLDLKTDLKSLKYGSDQPGGGDSGQPYQKVDINTVDSGFNRFRMTKFDDGLVRGGVVGAANAAIVDTLRIGKFLKDFPKGPLFIVKQVGLQLSNPQLETKKLKTDNPTKGGGLLNNIGNLILNTANKLTNAVGPTRIYNLGINTLAQVPVNAFGQHFDRHGLLPVQDDQTKYLAVAQNNNNEENNRLTGLKNRFGLGVNYDLYKGNIRLRRGEQRTLSVIAATFAGGVPFANSVYNDIQNSRIADYIGGPNSVYGIGRTLIQRVPERTNDNLKIDYAKNRNYNIQHIPEVKISSSFDFGISLLTTSKLTDSSFDLIKDTNLNINSSFLEYNAITTYSSSLSLAETNQKNSFISASRNIRNFVQASLRSKSIYGKEDFNNGFSLYSNPENDPRTLGDKTPLYYKTNSSYKGSSIIVKSDIKLSNKTTSSLSLIKTKTFSSGKPYQQNNFNRFELSPSLSGSLLLDGNPVTYDGGKPEGKLITSNDLGLSKLDRSIPTGSINIDNNAIPYTTPTLKKYAELRKKVDEGTSIVQDTYTTNGVDFEKFATTKVNISRNDPYLFYIGSELVNKFKRTNDRNVDEDTLALKFMPLDPFTGKVLRTLKFLGYITDYSENYDSSWDPIKYAGRNESFYIFKEFKRTATVGFNIPCFNADELEQKHCDMSELASVLAGKYQDNLLLGGIITRLKVGRYINDQPGIITNLSFSPIQDSSWDLDKELAFYLKVSFGFILIHNFLPQYGKCGFIDRQPDPIPETVPEDDDNKKEDTKVTIKVKDDRALIDSTLNANLAATQQRADFDKDKILPLTKTQIEAQRKLLNSLPSSN